MGTAVTMKQGAEASPSSRARITGVVYFLYFLTAVVGGVFMRGIVVSGDAAATATNILAHEASFRLGFALGLVSIALYIAVTALFYQLFAPVNRNLSLLAAFLSLVGLTIQAVSYIFLLAPWSSCKTTPMRKSLRLSRPSPWHSCFSN